MNTDIKNLSGYVRVRIKPQEARPRWMQKALQKALEGGQGVTAQRHLRGRRTRLLAGLSRARCSPWP